MYHRSAVSLLVLALSLCAVAQRRSEPINLTVTIRYANEQKADAQLRVQLLTGGGVPMGEAMTDSRGQVEFSVGQGTYRLRVTGIKVEETTTAPFAVGFGELSHTEFVQVQARKDANAATAAGPAGTVSAGTLQVPKKAREAYEKGNRALAKNDWVEARKHFEKAVQQAPEFAAAQHNLGVACSRLEDNGCAQTALRAALRLDPKLMPAYLNLGRVELKAHNFAEAGALLRQYVAAAPQDPAGVLLLSEAELRSGQYDAALSDARRVCAMTQDANYAVAHYIAGRALEAQQRSAEAMKEYEAMLATAPRSPQASLARTALERLRTEQ